jgi:hypothetical protein
VTITSGIGILYHTILLKLGLDILSTKPNGSVEWIGEPNEELAALVFASLDKSLSSEECLALQTYLGGAEDPRWIAYVECRKQPIRQQREARYREETDSFRSNIDEFYEVGSEEWAAAMGVWKTAKQGIRDELPYPDGDVEDPAASMVARIQAMQAKYPVKPKT